MLLSHLNKLRQRGDTIIEVLVSITIVSFILTGSYVTSNHSLLDTRDAKEHNDALLLDQSQLEELKVLAANSPLTVFNQGNDFCITNVSTNQVAAAGSAQCTMNLDGQETNVEPEYSISIDYQPSNSTFTLTNSWPSVLGNGTTDQEQLIYGIYDTPAVAAAAAAAASTGGSAGLTSGGTNCFGLCAGGAAPANGKYRWDPKFSNITAPAETGEITACSWNFGDGTIIKGTLPGNDKSCLPGEGLNHAYTAPANLPPYPAACETISEATTLNITLDNGATPKDVYHFKLPQCY